MLHRIHINKDHDIPCGGFQQLNAEVNRLRGHMYSPRKNRPIENITSGWLPQYFLQREIVRPKEINENAVYETVLLL